MSRLERLTSDPGRVTADLERIWATGGIAVTASADAALRDESPAGPASVGLPDGAALVVRTAGSTGRPRAVVLTHAALEASVRASLARLDARAGERWALALPTQHIAGIQVVLRSRALGSPPVVVDDPGDPHQLAASVRSAAHIALVPTQLARCLDAGTDLSGFRSVLVGGGPLWSDLHRRAASAGVRVVATYGMTETAGGCVYDGTALDGVEFRCDDDGRIHLRGPMLASGTIGEDGTFAPLTSTGWFATSDLGQVTAADGRRSLTVLGRTDDIIITGGINVVPAAVEAAARTVAGVADAFVVGVPDPRWGQRVRVVVRMESTDARSGAGSSRSADELLERIRTATAASLPRAHAPTQLVIAEIPRGPLGKLTAGARAELADLPPTATHRERPS